MKIVRKVILLISVLALVLCFGGCSKSDKGQIDVPENKYAQRDNIDPEFYEFHRKKQQPSDNLDILTSYSWEYDFGDCAYELSLYKNGKFSNYCACGSPAGYSDMVEYYIYDDDNKAIYMYDAKKQYIGQGTIEKISKNKVTIKKYGEVCKYKADEKLE